MATQVVLQQPASESTSVGRVVVLWLADVVDAARAQRESVVELLAAQLQFHLSTGRYRSKPQSLLLVSADSTSNTDPHEPHEPHEISVPAARESLAAAVVRRLATRSPEILLQVNTRLLQVRRSSAQTAESSFPVSRQQVLEWLSAEYPHALVLPLLPGEMLLGDAGPVDGFELATKSASMAGAAERVLPDYQRFVMLDNGEGSQSLPFQVCDRFVEQLTLLDGVTDSGIQTKTVLSTGDNADNRMDLLKVLQQSYPWTGDDLPSDDVQSTAAEPCRDLNDQAAFTLYDFALTHASLFAQRLYLTGYAAECLESYSKDATDLATWLRQVSKSALTLKTGVAPAIRLWFDLQNAE